MMKRNSGAYTFLLAVSLVMAIAGLLPDEASAFEYKSLGRRDPFVPLIGVPQDGTRGGARGVLTVDDVVLQGIVIDPAGKRSAIINGEFMTEGDSIGVLTVESIDANVVKIKIDEDEHEIKLYEE